MCTGVYSCVSNSMRIDVWVNVHVNIKECKSLMMVFAGRENFPKGKFD